ncbi:small-conductance mechanosensitive channel [Litorivivens lipolytica]|uniref:Small-conductance mechanosensitive channel n=1 Tax=Litorivivens lipolytica TaxID=1524264 RepID=A0A7W4W2W3_9GAMM|nr:mechanosensitive ion channel domain-containing protein [Litorivivens lipolytica]MBB3046320.1 small-conductance mechanosensitive channel [Litorivivens lipolytica]
MLDISFSSIMAVLRYPLVDLGKGPVTLASIMLGLGVIFASLYLAKLLKQNVKNLNRGRYALTPSSIYTLERISHYLVMIVGVLVGISVMGVDFGKLALIVSALSVGIGFGLQAIVSNFVSGLIILLERSLKVGDFVQLDSGVTGVVSEIRVRATVITTAENSEVIVPNAEFVNGKVTNFTHTDNFCRHRIPFGVAYGTDKALMTQCVLDAALAQEMTLSDTKEHQPQVVMKSFGDSSLDFELLVWTKPEYSARPSLVRGVYLSAIDDAFRDANISVPFPQRDLHFITDRRAPGS